MLQQLQRGHEHDVDIVAVGGRFILYAADAITEEIWLRGKWNCWS
jgi:hypothetical protein